MAELLFGKVVSAHFPEQIAGRIEDLILGNRLHPGDKLPSERELASKFGVSRAVVREAIKLLEERGLLEPRNGRGAFVTVPGSASITSSLNAAYRMQDCSAADFHEARWCLESFIVRLAAMRATEADIVRIEAAVAIMDDSMDDPERFMPADVEFHDALACATHNPLLAVMSQPLVQMILVRGAIGFTYGDVTERHQNHRRILECLKHRDPDGAEAVVRQHLDLSMKALEGARPSGTPAP